MEDIQERDPASSTETNQLPQTKKARWSSPVSIEGFFALWNPVKFKFFVFTRSVLASHNTTGRHDKKLMLINYIKKR